MRAEIMELEKVLNQEIEAYSRLEKYILDKKDCLVKGDIEKLRNIDSELEKFHSITQELELKRKKATTQFSDENLTLNEIIDRIQGNENASRLSNTRNKLKNILVNIQKQNRINAQLIENSFRIIEHTVITIANALVPESSSYNNYGKTKNGSNGPGISSIIQEA